MALAKLAGVDPVHISTEGLGRDRSQRNPYQRPPERRSGRTRFLAATVPARDPETCEVDYVIDDTGALTAILVRDVLTGDLLARVESADLSSLGGEEAASGLLYERRG